MEVVRSVKIIALNGSPRRDGNTSVLMRWVADGCAEMGARVEWLNVVDYNIRYCQGCFTCLRSGVCPLADDFLALREKLLTADGLVVGSPVYEGAPTAQLKTLMDRLTLLHLYTNLFENLFSVGIATSGIAPTKGVASELASFFGRRSGYIGATTSTVAHGYRPLAQAHDPRLPLRARKLGKRLVADILSPERFRLPQWNRLFYRMMWSGFLLPMAMNNPTQFTGVLRLLDEKGKLPKNKWILHSPYRMR